MLHHQTKTKNFVVFVFLTTFFLIAAPAASQVQQTSEIRELQPNKTIEREMTGAQTHRYKFDLKADEFFQVRAEQKGVDAALRLTDAGGNVLAAMDSPNGKERFEILSFIAEKSGGYVLEIGGFDEKTEKGIYTVCREPSRTANAADKRRVEVERLFVEGMTVRNIMKKI